MQHLEQDIAPSITHCFRAFSSSEKTWEPSKPQNLTTDLAKG
jgi:hypothetical protein